MRTPTAEQIRAYLDDLAVLIAAHGLVVDADVTGHMCLDPLQGRYGGYIARLRDQAIGAPWWDVGKADPRAAEADFARIEAIQAEHHRRSQLSAHERMAEAVERRRL
jgi:hypothetical protein